MRRKFNLDLPELSEMMLLVHGRYGVGKSYFGGDMLRHEQKQGAVKFVNVVGEDGASSLGDLGLGDIGEHAETYDDLREIVRELRKDPIRAVVFDSATQIGRVITRHITGSDRPPRMTKEINEHGLINWEIRDFFTGLRGIAKIVMVISPSDKSVDQMTGKILWTPDLPGRNAVGVSGFFDMVFVLDSEVLGPNRIRRKLLTAPAGDVVIRTRLPRPLPTEIELPEGGGGWAKVYAAIQSTFQSKKTA